MQWLSTRLGRKEAVPDEWYSVTQADFVTNHGSYLLGTLYNGSPFQLLSTLYPEASWHPWRFHLAPRGLWRDKSVQKQFLLWVEHELGYTQPEDWYQVSYRQLVALGGESLLLRSPSLYDLLIEHFPTYQLQPWFFNTVPTNYWKSKENRKAYVEWLVRKVQVNDATQLKQKHFNDNHGSGLLHIYKNSPDLLIQSIESNYTPKASLINPKDQREFVNDLAKKLGFQVLDEARWYSLRIAELKAVGGYGFLNKYFHSSIYLMLVSLYPEVDWKPHKFRRVVSSMKKNPTIVKEIVSYAEEALKIQVPSDWNRVSLTQLKENGLLRFFKAFGGVQQVLQAKYPEMNWSYLECTHPERK